MNATEKYYSNLLAKTRFRNMCDRLGIMDMEQDSDDKR